MFPFQRWIAVTLMVTLVPQLNGCSFSIYGTQRVAPGELRPEELGGRPRVVGATTVEGRTVSFDSVAARQTPDTLYGWLRGSLFAFDRHSVARLLVNRPGEEPASITPSQLRSALDSRPPIEGVTTANGDTVPFDPGGDAYVTRDTLFATVSGNPFRLPVQSAREVWVRRKDQASSTVLSVAVTALLVLPVALGIASCVQNGCGWGNWGGFQR